MKRVYSSHNLAAVHHAKNVLEAQGIRALVRNQFLSSAMGELPPAECLIELWVLREADVPGAESALREAFSVKSGPTWACKRCGESCEAQFTQCWKCGAFRPSGTSSP